MDIITLALAKKQIGKDTTKAVSDYLDEHLTNPTNPPLDTSLTIANAAADSKATGDKLSELKEDLTAVDEELTLISGTVLPPSYAIGARYVSNGVDTWTNNTIRMSFAKGTYAKLKQGDVVTRNTTAISYFIGGYSTDGGSTFTAISGTYNSYTVPADGLYFFCLVKQGDATFTDNDLENAWSYLKITRSNNSMEDRLAAVEETSEATAIETADIKDAIDYEVAPITPTEYYEMPYPNTDINYNGIDVENTNTEASGYIPIDSDFYDVCIVVNSTSVKYGLGGIFYYNASKAFQLRVLPGTSYEFSTFNGETVIWLNITKDNPNYKYVRFVEENNRNYKYWIVEKGAKAKVLDEYGQLPFIGKTIVNFGDSIFGQTRPPKDVSSYLAIKTGATVINAGFGGCEMSRHADSNYDPFSMYRLADAIATGTWTLQETAASTSGMPAYFAETISVLKALDFSTVNIVTIAYGTNDWNNSSPIDHGGNSDMTGFADALRYSIETLLTAYPNLRIFVCTQTYRYWMDAQGAFTEDSNTKVNPTTNTKLTDFVQKTEEVANEYQLPCINDYNIGMNRYNRSFYFYPTDGTHPKPTGNQLIADNIASKIY